MSSVYKESVPYQWAQFKLNLYKMRFIVVLFAVIIGSVLAGTLNDPKLAETLRYENDNIGVDGYNFAYVVINIYFYSR